MTEYAGYGTTLEIEIASVWTMVAQVVDLDGPSIEAEQIEVSHRGDDSTFDRYRRFVAGLIDAGEMSFDIIFDPDHASHDPTITGSLYDLIETGDTANFRINFPGVGSAVTRAAFQGFVSSFGITSPLEDGLKADIAIKITGAITWSHVP